MSIASPLEFWLIPHRPATILTAQVNGTLSNPFMTVPYDNDTLVSNPIAGNTVWFGTTQGGRERGVLRLRSWNGSNSISVAENDDVTPYVQNNDWIKITQEWRLFPIYPRALINGLDATVFIDYDVAWNNQTKNWKPVAVAGPPAVSEYNGTNFQAKFVGDRSFALAVGASITGYLWTAPGSAEGTSTSQGTEGSPVTFTWTSTGQKLVYLRVTDSNGNTHTNYTWAFGVDPNSPNSVAYTQFDAFNDNIDFEQGGGQCSFTVHGQATIADFPNEGMVILASRGDLDTPTGYWPFRSNVHFVGYVVGKSVRQNPIEGDISFRATTIDGLLRNTTAFPVSLTDKNTPQDWTMAKVLNVDRAASYLWHYYSTLSLMTSIVPTNYTARIHRQDFGPGDIYSQLQGELLQSIWGNVVSNHQSVLYHTIDYQLMNNSERSGVTTRKMLHKGVWVDDVIIEERDNYEWPTNQVKMSGVYYPGGEVDDVCPSFSEAPGNAPKTYGKELNYDGLIITGQNDLNIRCGRALAKQILDYPSISMRFLNDGSFTIVPQEIFPTNIEAADNDRGIVFSEDVLPRRMSRYYDNQLGTMTIEVGFEPVADGPPGTTVDLPCGPPEQIQPSTYVSPSPSASQGPQALAASTLVSSFYFANKVGQTWQRRVNGLDEASGQLAFYDMIGDPWSTFKNGWNIEQIIMWGCGSGFLVQSKNSGNQWEDHTPYIENLSWQGETHTATGTIIKQVLGDLFRKDTFYYLFQSASGSSYRGWIGRSTDDGFTFNTWALTGTSQAYPIRMDVDKQDGSTLLVTLWESTGNISLRKYAIAAAGLSYTTAYTMMTGTSVSDVIANTYTAMPYTPIGNKSLIYVYGRLTNPQGLAGTYAVINTTNGGAAWASVVNNWSGSYCGAFHASEANQAGQHYLYGVRQED